MKLSSKKPIVLFDIDYTLFDTAFFKQSGLSMHKIYAEVMQTLDGLNNFATLGIFSKGETQFQKTKLEKTGMAKFFKEENVHGSTFYNLGKKRLVCGKSKSNS